MATADKEMTLEELLAQKSELERKIEALSSTKFVDALAYLKKQGITAKELYAYDNKNNGVVFASIPYTLHGREQVYEKREGMRGKFPADIAKAIESRHSKKDLYKLVNNELSATDKNKALSWIESTFYK